MKVGSLVVCVDDVFTGEYNEELKRMNVIFPVKDKIYTVRDTEMLNGRLCIFLEEIVNRKIQYQDCYDEQSWWSRRFRELDTPTEIKLENILELEIV